MFVCTETSEYVGGGIEGLRHMVRMVMMRFFRIEVGDGVYFVSSGSIEMNAVDTRDTRFSPVDTDDGENPEFFAEKLFEGVFPLEIRQDILLESHTEKIAFPAWVMR